MKCLPSHIAIIMDGNSRWAKINHVSQVEGHRSGAKHIRTIVEVAIEYEIANLTLFAFSTENWGRPSSEIAHLLQIFSDLIDKEIDTLHENRVRLLHMGSMHKLPQSLKRKLVDAINLTKNNTRLNLIIAWDYGGRAEITDALRSMINMGIRVDEVNEETVRNHLYLPEVPDPDFIIRTGGRKRISNFLLWQAAYSEIYFTDTYWPDFNRMEFIEAIKEYSIRERLFGKRINIVNEEINVSTFLP